MADLTDEMKDEIVRRLARYETATNIAKVVAEDFGLPAGSISLRQIASYNPGIASFEGAQRFVYLYDAERKRWTEEHESHDITKMGYRVARLQRMSEAAEKAGNFVLAAALLKQAAEDHGGSYSNVRDHRVSGTIDHRRQLTPIEARQELAQRIASLRALPAGEQVIDNETGDTVSRS